MFFSFRGPDTRRGFLSHLCNSLGRAKIDYYIDDRLERGDEISPALIQAIQGSAIAVIVFSEDYAKSSWCLRELEEIIDCHRTKGQRVLPVFYRVDPSQVRHQKGKYGEAFEYHKKRISEDQAKVWAAALHQAANFSGFDLSHFRYFNFCLFCFVLSLLLLVYCQIFMPRNP